MHRPRLYAMKFGLQSGLSLASTDKAFGELHVQMPTRDLLLLHIKRKYWNVNLSSLRTFTFCSSFYVISFCWVLVNYCEYK